MDRDKLGRVVREAWVRWALTRPDPKPSWLVPYDELSEPDKEADRQIGEAVLDHINVHRIELAERKSGGVLSPAEASEFEVLQAVYFNALGAIRPRPDADLAGLRTVEAKLAGQSR